MAKKVYEETNIAAIAAKIREKTRTDIKYKPSEMMDGVNEVYEEGKKAEYDRFWDEYQEKGKRQYYQYAFYGSGWVDATFKPKYAIKPVNANSMFMGSYITDLIATIDMTKSGSSSTLFDSTPNLKQIDKIIVTTSTKYDAWFRSAAKLERIVFEGVIGQNSLNLQWSTKLTHDTLMNIINCLEDKTGDTSGTEWKITIGTTNKAKLTDDELSIAYNKGWGIV